MIVEPMPSLFKVDAATRMSTAGADWYPRRNVETGRVHWFYGPRLFHGDGQSASWCTASTAMQVPLLANIPNAQLSEDLTGGTPCPECTAKWSMT